MSDFYEVARRGKMGFDLVRAGQSALTGAVVGDALPGGGTFLPSNSAGSCNFFSKEDDDFIKENLTKLSYRQIGMKLGRTSNSISGRINRLGWSKPSRERVAKYWFKSATESRGVLQKIKSKKFLFQSPHKKSPKPATPPQPDLICSTEFLCDLVSLDNHSCRWPIGDPRSAEFKYCGVKEAVFPFSPYCRFHSKMNYAT